MDCLPLPFIRVQETVSWTQRFLMKHLAQKSKYIYDKTNLKAMFAEFYYSKTTSYFEQPNRHFCQHFMRRTTQQTFLTISLASQQKTTKLYFSSQVRKQFKLLTVPFKPCLRSDKLVYCHVWKFCKDVFLNFRVIWSVNQIVFLMVSSLILLRSLRVYILKQLLFSISLNVA